MRTYNLDGSTVEPLNQDFRTETEAIRAFEGGADFKVTNRAANLIAVRGSIRDFNPGDKVTIRFNRLADCTLYEVS